MTSNDLATLLRSLDGKGYKAYKQIGDRYEFDGWTLRFDHVQGDPFADPTRISALVPADSADIPRELLSSPARRISAADFLNRTFATSLRGMSDDRGSGRSGELSILLPGQEVLRRTSMTVAEDGSIEARLRVGLPARGRTILGNEAARLLSDALPQAVETALTGLAGDPGRLTEHVQLVEDAQALRAELGARSLVAFVADGSILPRRSGVDDRPMTGDSVVPFQSPESLRVTLPTPNRGPVTGMGIPEGVTLLVGGGFHGKSTLLRALQRGVYEHAPGDGRELVVTRRDAVKVRAEDGRSIPGTDISAFISNLPGSEDTSDFHTANASGSTSQAAAISEALEMGSECLLIDEDTSATNFLIRDARVQALIEKADEPITPFIDRVADLRSLGVSLVLVVGGSGDFFDVADTVVAMRSYLPREVTAAAKDVVQSIPTRRVSEKRSWQPPSARTPKPEEIKPRRGRRDVQIKAFSAHRLSFGTSELDLSAVEQLVEAAQTRAIARALAWSREECIDGERITADALRCVMEALADDMDVMDPRTMGNYAEFRIYELAAVLNRLR